MARPLDDASVIHAALRPFGRERESLSWITRPWILAFCFGPAALMLAMWSSTGLLGSSLPGVLAMGVGTYFALFLLSDRPLISPVQAFVMLFHVWFAVAVAVCAGFYLLKERPTDFLKYYDGGSIALYVAAAGLPLYALTCRLIIERWPPERSARFTTMTGPTLSWRTILTLAAVGVFVQLVLVALRFVGVTVSDETSYLGGGAVNNPLLQAFAGMATLGNELALYSAVHKIVFDPEARRRYWIPVALAVLISIGFNLFSGTKGMVVNFAPATVMAYISLRQRLPVGAIFAAVLVYLGFVAPFVDNSRALAQVEAISTTEQRRDLFLGEFQRRISSPELVTDVNIESPFRGMYIVATIAMETGTDWSGRWGGQTISDGLSTILPRSLNPAKGDANVGNFFARELGAAPYTVYDHNLVMSLPMEFASNYGSVAGVLAFIPIGIFIAVYSCWFLGVRRLATHPFAGWLWLSFVKFEASLGQWANALKGLPGLFLALYLVYLFLRWQEKQRSRSASAGTDGIAASPA